MNISSWLRFLISNHVLCRQRAYPLKFPWHNSRGFPPSHLPIMILVSSTSHSISRFLMVLWVFHPWCIVLNPALPVLHILHFQWSWRHTSRFVSSGFWRSSSCCTYRQVLLRVCVSVYVNSGSWKSRLIRLRGI